MDKFDRSDDSIQLGKVINSIQLVDIIGQGSFATVYLGKKNSKKFAVKSLSKANLSPSQLQVLADEIYILQEVQSRNVVWLIEVVEEKDYIYLIMDYYPHDLLTYLLKFNPHLSVKKSFFIQMCQAVEYCHSKGVYHRDLKLENILVKGGSIYLADFGLATHDDLSLEFGCGSITYMSPECNIPSSSIPLSYFSAANDVWSLGILLINLLTNKNPWGEADLSDCDYYNYRSNKNYFKARFDFGVGLLKLLDSVFTQDPFKRPSVAKLIEIVIDLKFYDSIDTNDADDTKENNCATKSTAGISDVAYDKRTIIVGGLPSPVESLYRSESVSTINSTESIGNCADLIFDMEL